MNAHLPAPRVITLEDVEIATCEHFRLSRGLLLGESRHRPIAYARAVALYLSHRVTPWSWTDIGDHFNRDHTSAIYASKRVESNMEMLSHAYAIESALRGRR